MTLPATLALAAFLATASPGDAPFDLDAALERIAPDASELAWQRIPWRIDLLEARREAARAGRPIFLWEMDGHPLGCT